MWRALLACVLMFASGRAQAQQDASRHMFVQASRLAVRRSPTPTAAIVSFATTNDEVEVVQQTGNWCQIRVTTAAAGYVPCIELVAIRLDRAAVAAHLNNPALAPRERLEWRSRAFWISPSLSAFEAVGVETEEALLGSKALEAETMKGTSARRRAPEFEAMKRRLERGISARVVAPQGEPPPQDSFGHERETVALPRIRSSFFHSGDVLLAQPLRPFTIRAHAWAPGLVDVLSSAFGATYVVRSWLQDGYAHFGHIGLWDVGGAVVTFDRPVTIHGVTVTGAPTGYTLTDLTAPLGSSGCSGSAMSIHGHAVNAGAESR